MHTLKVLVFAGPCPERGQLFAHAEDWVARVPVLLQRLIELPWSLGQPILIDDGTFELGAHLRTITLASGAEGGLDAVVSELARAELPRDRPLWQVFVVDGLPGRRWALVVKIHHALADGAAAVAMLMRMLEGPRSRPRVEVTPTFGAKLALGLGALGHSVIALPGLLVDTLRTTRAVRGRRRRGGPRPSGIFEAPMLPFDDIPSGVRHFARTELPMARVAAIKDRASATVNDVLLTIVAGALRRYLIARNELPASSLVASVPVAGRKPHLSGNDMTSLFAAIPAHMGDPMERLRVVHESMIAGKEELALEVEVQRAWLEALPPFAVGPIMNAPTKIGMSMRSPPINLVISSVRGPSEPIRVAGRDLESIHSVGPLVEGVGLNVTVWSYRGQLFFALIAGATMPDVSDLASELEPALAELESATQSMTVPRATQSELHGST